MKYVCGLMGIAAFFAAQLEWGAAAESPDKLEQVNRFRVDISVAGGSGKDADLLIGPGYRRGSDGGGVVVKRKASCGKTVREFLKAGYEHMGYEVLLNQGEKKVTHYLKTKGKDGEVFAVIEHRPYVVPTPAGTKKCSVLGGHAARGLLTAALVINRTNDLGCGRVGEAGRVPGLSLVGTDAAYLLNETRKVENLKVEGCRDGRNIVRSTGPACDVLKKQVMMFVRDKKMRAELTSYHKLKVASRITERLQFNKRGETLVVTLDRDRRPDARHSAYLPRLQPFLRKPKHLSGMSRASGKVCMINIDSSTEPRGVGGRDFNTSSIDLGLYRGLKKIKDYELLFINFPK